MNDVRLPDWNCGQRIPNPELMRKTAVSVAANLFPRDGDGSPDVAVTATRS